MNIKKSVFRQPLVEKSKEYFEKFLFFQQDLIRGLACPGEC
jgi:hypothetical protein